MKKSKIKNFRKKTTGFDMAEKDIRNFTGRMPPDLHIHTPLSRHGEGSMEETVLAAVAKGFQEIGFADHFYYPEGYAEPAPDCVIPDQKTFESYVSEVERLRKRYGDRVQIRLGAEIDYLPENMDAVREHLKLYPFDYIIGSVHIVDGVAIDYREDWLAPRLDCLGGAEGLWSKYWRDLEAFISLGLFDVVGHFDIPKKFRVAHTGAVLSQEAECVLNVIQKMEIAIEVNTGGIDKAAAHETYPSTGILTMAVRKGIDIVFGSDAHKPADVGRYFHQTAAFLRSVGREYAISFSAREKIEVPFT
jgi:histidinol-phosphatase (PHP family)